MVVFIRIVDLSLVINVKYLDFELVIAFKVVLDRNFCNPLWIEIVVYHFRLAKLLPRIALFLEQSKYWIGF